MSYEDKIWDLDISKKLLMENVAERVKNEASIIGYDADREIEKLKKRIVELEADAILVKRTMKTDGYSEARLAE